jgi:HSP20 family protein
VNLSLKKEKTMADVNVEKRQREQGRNLERRPQGLIRRGEFGFPSLFGRGPEELFSLSPFTLMRRLTEDMDRMFSGFGGGGFATREMGPWAPPVEIREQDGNLVVSAELPGVNKEDVKVEVTSDGLVIQGERKFEREEERGGVRRSERAYGAFYREIPLPEGAEIDKAKAQYNNGVLEIRVPISAEQRKTREIPIEAGGAEQRKAVGSQTEKQPTQTSKAG